MKKPASLRQAIAAAVPGLEANPDKFLVFVDEGTVEATGSKTLSFSYRYTLNLILLDFTGDPDVVMVALLAWVKRHQCDLVNNPDKRRDGITFEVDHLNNTSCDLSVKLSLAEQVSVKTAQGAHTITHLEEPLPEWEIEGLAG